MTTKQKRKLHERLALMECDARLEVRIPGKLLEQAKRFAQREGRDLSSTVRYLIAAGIKEAGR